MLVDSPTGILQSAHVGAALFALTLGATPMAKAQGAAELDRVEVAMWPEYDRPEILVILRAWLPAKAALPNQVAFKVPASAGVPHATAKRAADGTLLMAPFNREVKGNVATITIDTDRPEVRLEYYMPMQLEGSLRSFAFEWLGGAQVAELTYEVQQPPTATQFTVSPPSTQQGTGPDGLLYHRGTLGVVATGETKSLAVKYTKPSAVLTVAGLRPTAPLAPPVGPTPGVAPSGAPSVPPGMPGASTPSAPTASPPPVEQESGSTWIVVILIGLLVAIGGAWVALSGKNGEEKAAGSG